MVGRMTDTITKIPNRPPRYDVRRADAISVSIQNPDESGNPLQTASNVLCLSPLEPKAAAKRFRRLVSVFETHGMRIYQEDYDEVALLTLLDTEADDLAHRILDVRQELRALSPVPGPELAFNLACQIAFLERSACEGATKDVTGLKALLDMQGIVHAQRAITVAAAGLIVAI